MHRRLVPALLASGLLLVGLGPLATAAAAPAAAALAVTDRQVEKYATGTFARFAERLSDGSVQVRTVTRSGTVTQNLGGRVRGAPAILQPLRDGIAVQIFARGLDDRLWLNEQFYDDSWAGWRPIGGVLTSQPGASPGPGGVGFDVHVRGRDGAVWNLRSRTTRGYTVPWARVGGRLAPETGPAPTPTPNGWDVVVQGTDGGLWLSSWTSSTGRWSGFTSLGGRITHSPGVGHSRQTVAVARGVDGAAWLRTRSQRWVSLGRKIVGSPTVASGAGGDVARVYATGTDGRLYTGTWSVGRRVWSGWRRTG